MTYDDLLEAQESFFPGSVVMSRRAFLNLIDSFPKGDQKDCALEMYFSASGDEQHVYYRWRTSIGIRHGVKGPDYLSAMGIPDGVLPGSVVFFDEHGNRKP